MGISRSTYYKYKDYVMELSAKKTSEEGDNLYAATTRNWRAGEVNPRDC